MPVHRSYDVTCDKEGQNLGGAVSGRKSWILPLITFFVLAGAILTVCLLMRRPVTEHPVNGIQAANTNSNLNDYEPIYNEEKEIAEKSGKLEGLIVNKSSTSNDGVSTVTKYFGTQTTLTSEDNIFGRGHGDSDLAPTLSPGTPTNMAPGKMTSTGTQGSDGKNTIFGDVPTPTSPSRTSTTSPSGTSTTASLRTSTLEQSSEASTTVSLETSTLEQSSEAPMTAPLGTSTLEQSSEASTTVSLETSTLEQSSEAPMTAPLGTSTLEQSSEASTTASLGTSTLEQSSEAPTTASLGTSTLEQSSEASTTASLGTSTLEQSSEASTTASLGTSTLEQSSEASTTAPLGTSTLEQSSEASTTASLGTSTLEQSSEASTTASLGTSTLEQSSKASTTAPLGTSTLEQSSEASTTASLGTSTLEQSSEAPTTASLGTSTLEQSSEASTTASLGTSTLEQSSEASTTASLGTSTLEQSSEASTTAPLGTSTLEQSSEASTTASLGTSTLEQSSEASTTASLGTSTLEQSSKASTTAPLGTSTLEQSSEASTTASLGTSTLEQSSEASTTASLGTSTLEQSSEASTTVSLETSTLEQSSEAPMTAPLGTSTLEQSSEASTTASLRTSTLEQSFEAPTTASLETSALEQSSEASTTASLGTSTLEQSSEASTTVSLETSTLEQSSEAPMTAPLGTSTLEQSSEASTTASLRTSTLEQSFEAPTTASLETSALEQSSEASTTAPLGTSTLEQSSEASTTASLGTSTLEQSSEASTTASLGTSTLEQSSKASTTAPLGTSTLEQSSEASRISTSRYILTSVKLVDTGEDKKGHNDLAPIENSVYGQEYSLETRNQRVARMISYMNETADPCEDFYEYACGKFETSNNSISEKNLVQEVTEQIFVQAKKTTNSSVSEQFLKFYNSCVDYQKNFNKSERMKLVMQIVNEVGRFEGTHNDFDVTEMLLKLFSRNSAPLFDITLDIAESILTDCEGASKPAAFAFKIGPPILENTQYENQTERDCYDKQKSEKLSKNVSLHHLYEGLRECKDDVNSFLDSVVKVLGELRTAESPNEKTLDIDNINKTIEVLIKTFSIRDFRTENTRKKYLTKNYEGVKDARSIAKTIFHVGWEKLIRNLTDSPTASKSKFQIYVDLNKNKQTLSGPLRSSLHNALLALYAHEVYNKFVIPRSDVENYCKGVTIDLMKMHASSLYMSSFSSEQLMKMNATVTKMFEELRDTLKSSMIKASNIINTDNATIIRKIRNLTIAVPDISYYQNGSKLDPENNENKVQLTGNFLKDTIMLESKNRNSMYRLFKKSPSEDKHIWTYFAQPYQSSSSAIYALNKIILPYGIVDWATLFSDETNNATHLVLATLGTRIAKEIAHHFDPTGIIQYFGNVRGETKFAAFCDDPVAQRMYQRHIEKYQQKTHRTYFLPSTHQTVDYQITDLSLNERFSEITGLQLAYDTMLRLPKLALPWPTEGQSDERKQFFLAYAQMYCTKVPLTSSYKSSYEDEHLPSRLLISEVGSNNKFLGETWRCSEGSRMRPENISSTFPNMEYVPPSTADYKVE